MDTPEIGNTLDNGLKKSAQATVDAVRAGKTLSKIAANLAAQNYAGAIAEAIKDPGSVIKVIIAVVVICTLLSTMLLVLPFSLYNSLNRTKEENMNVPINSSDFVDAYKEFAEAVIIPTKTAFEKEVNKYLPARQRDIQNEAINEVMGQSVSLSDFPGCDRIALQRSSMVVNMTSKCNGKYTSLSSIKTISEPIIRFITLYSSQDHLYSPDSTAINTEAMIDKFTSISDRLWEFRTEDRAKKKGLNPVEKVNIERGAPIIEERQETVVSGSDAADVEYETVTVRVLVGFNIKVTYAYYVDFEGDTVYAEEFLTGDPEKDGLIENRATLCDHTIRPFIEDLLSDEGEDIEEGFIEDMGEFNDLVLGDFKMLSHPAPGSRVTSRYGSRMLWGKPDFHRGIDFANGYGTPILAVADGIVASVRFHNSWGNYLVVYHGKTTDGRSIQTLYAHNSSIAVSPGQVVSAGQTIAYMGSTGNSSGNHCHLELLIGGMSGHVDPAPYLP